MVIKQFEIWIANLNPQNGTEPGKTRPVVIVQSNLLNKMNHPSTVVCPITTKVKNDVNILRIHLKKGMSNLHQDCDIILDQVRSIDNKRLINKVGDLPKDINYQIKENLLILFDIE
jgi:mRNA interferase MazF